MKVFIQVPMHFHRRIVGKRGCVVSSIEKRNRVMISAVEEARTSSRLAALDKAVNGKKIKGKFDYSSKGGLLVMLLVCCLSHPSVGGWR